ncbi:ubiquitin carboxyl-terminal hydrolase 31-like [Parus major]|uniref:ubiquitin carboxyl-terminal hydrolase 31-like n=1 Tax=Parus major TaxID=9157 RepID=UPI0014447FFC|nr:ubiquitin carboxyl-terminal hydrolase 31-like [Parus major]
MAAVASPLSRPGPARSRCHTAASPRSEGAAPARRRLRLPLPPRGRPAPPPPAMALPGPACAPGQPGLRNRGAVKRQGCKHFLKEDPFGPQLLDIKPGPCILSSRASFLSCLSTWM